MITTHTQLLNAIIEKYWLQSYLEIGVQNPANNFDKIKCKEKTGVDPYPLGNPLIGTLFYCDSDTFFLNKKEGKYDLIFIDGLHHADQVKRDFENSLHCLSDNGFIVIHDVLPENEQGTFVPRETKIWWGDVYKFAMTLPEYKNIKWVTFNIDNGCLLIQKSDNPLLIKPTQYPVTWKRYLEERKRVMKISDDIIF